MFDDLRPHLAELRKRLGLSVLSVFVAFIIAFIFHNGILTWITQPLNDALVEVGRIVESQDKATWHMQTTEQNTTITIKEESSSAVAAKLQNRLEEAAKIADTSSAFYLMKLHLLQKSLARHSKILMPI